MNKPNPGIRADRAQGGKRHGRMGVVLSLCLGLAAGGAGLLAKHQFGPLREEAALRIRRALPPSVSVEQIEISGLTRAELTGFSYAAEDARGVRTQISAPKVALELSLWDLLGGLSSASRVHIKWAQVVLDAKRASEGDVCPVSFEDLALPSSLTHIPFSLRVDRAEVTVRNLFAEDANLLFSDVELDNGVGLEWTWFGAKVSLPAGEEPLASALVNFGYGADGLWRGRAELSNVAVGQWPFDTAAVSGWLDAGRANAVVQLDSYGEGKALLTAEAHFDNLLSRYLPPSSPPVQGVARLQGEADWQSRQLRINGANITSSVGEGTGEATLEWPEDGGGAPSAITYQLHASHLAMEHLLAILSDAMPEGDGLTEGMDLQLDGPVKASLSGSFGDWAEAGREVGTYLQLQALQGRLRWRPENIPGLHLSLPFSGAEVRWDDAESRTRVLLHAEKGKLEFPETKLSADDLSGTVELDGGILRCAPLRATINGGVFSGSIQADLAAKTGTVELRGLLPNIENTFLHDRIRDTLLSGDALVDARARFEPAGLSIEGTVDATSTRIGHRWWFLKPPGIGVRASISAEVFPGERVSIDAGITGQKTRASAQIEMRQRDGRMDLREIRTQFESLDIITIGQCLRLPYRLVGGQATQGHYNWHRDPGRADNGRGFWHAEGACFIDEAILRAETARVPMEASGLQLVFEAVNSAQEKTGRLRARAAEARMPSFGETWFVAVDPPPHLLDLFPPEPRDFFFELEAESLLLPPWTGRQFKGSALYTHTAEGKAPLVGVDDYFVRVEDGSLTGGFVKDRSTHVSRSNHAWEDIPVHYLLEHLGWPQVVTGLSNGSFSYERDQDDPASLRGNGQFDVSAGLFSADFLLRSLTRHLEGDPGALPPSLEFQHLGAQIELEGDTVKTPEFSLRTAGLSVDAGGAFVRHGDLDYDVRMSISPDTAQRIEPLRDYLNIEGHRIAQQDVQLSFHLSGTVDDPVQQLADAPPISVSLVTGSLEMVSDTLQVIDLPRKVIVDLLKMGGGILGVGQTRRGSGNP